MYPGTVLGRALSADSASSPMNTIASRNQFRPIKISMRAVPVKVMGQEKSVRPY